MKIIDKTPLQDAKGNISVTARVQGTLKYGLSWYGELEAQKAVIEQLERLLEKGFVLIRNFTLPNSEIVIPIILIGSGGIWVIYVTQVKGHFEAKGDQWNTIDADGKSQPAGINLIGRVSKLTGAFQKYLKIQKVDMPNPVESVLIAADPGAQIESLRPIARVVRSDAIKQFASSLLQARPIWRSEFIHELADRLVDPRPPVELNPVKAPDPEAAQQPASRAKAIFDASEQVSPFNTNDLGFEFEEDQAQPAQQDLHESNTARPLPRPKPAAGKKKLFGLSSMQLVILAGLFIFWFCILAGFGAFIYFTQ
jgi:hypothetical protein